MELWWVRAARGGREMGERPIRVVCPMETHGWPDNVPAMRRCPACGGDSYAGHYPILATLADPEAEGERLRKDYERVSVQYQEAATEVVVGHGVIGELRAALARRDHPTAETEDDGA